MPIRGPVLDPLLNIVRASHVELGVRNLAAVCAFDTSVAGVAARAPRPARIIANTGSAPIDSHAFAGLEFPATRNRITPAIEGSPC